MITTQTLLSLKCTTDDLVTACKYAQEKLMELAEVLKKLREKWLPTAGGEWADKFVLLNRYLRTGVEPAYFSGERTEL